MDWRVWLLIAVPVLALFTGATGFLIALHFFPVNDAAVAGLLGVVAGGLGALTPVILIVRKDRMRSS